MHPNSLNLMRGFFNKYDSLCGKRTIDVGSFDVNGTYRPLVKEFGGEYVGLDIRSGPNVDQVVEENQHWKIEPADVVISGQCLEHVRRPWIWIRQVFEIVRPGGMVVIIAPWSHHIHDHPIDCWRILPVGMWELLNHGGFFPLDTGISENDCFGVGLKEPQACRDENS